jgi:O-antigen chain-terminating methyltransferase
MGADMVPTGPDVTGSQLERQRLDAEREYNAALTELDRAVAASTAEGGAAARSHIPRLATALIVFLQKITAFVETSDRRLAAELTRRLDGMTPAIDSIAELRTQVTVLQRTTQMLSRHQPSAVGYQPSAISHQPSAISHQPSAISHDDVTYVAFEDQFRGSGESVQQRLQEYLPLFAGAAGDNVVVDLGCGRGEFLVALKAAGISGRGVDANGEMAAVARERGLDVTHADALAFLSALPDDSIGGLMAAQVVEHLEPAYLTRLLAVASRKLRAGAPIALETINPACWLAFFSSYIRDLTHVKPIHPETLQFLLRASGFERVSIRYSAPVPEQMKMKPVELGSDVMRASDASAQALVDVARTLNANAAILNNLLFSYLDYAAIGYRG